MWYSPSLALFPAEGRVSRSSRPRVPASSDKRQVLLLLLLLRLLLPSAARSDVACGKSFCTCKVGGGGEMGRHSCEYPTASTAGVKADALVRYVDGRQTILLAVSVPARLRSSIRLLLSALHQTNMLPRFRGRGTACCTTGWASFSSTCRISSSALVKLQ